MIIESKKIINKSMMIGRFKPREYTKRNHEEVNVSKRRLPENPQPKEALDIRIVTPNKIMVVGLPKEFSTKEVYYS